jgi:CubicO group peptidase (beta-lactamase class C family)
MRTTADIDTRAVYDRLNPRFLAGVAHVVDDSVPPSIPTPAAIRSLLAHRIDACRLSVGLAVGTTERGDRRFVSHGHRDRSAAQAIDGDTLFEIGSITKLLTALLLADMADRREVSLADPVADYLPSGVRVPERHGRRITLLDLTAHRSGLPRRPTNSASQDPTNPYADYTADQLYEFLSGYTLTRGIGDQTEYSNLGVGLLGHALALRSGTDYETLVMSRICGPLGMASTAITLPPALAARLAPGHDDSLDPVPNWDLGILAGAGGLRSSAFDMLTFLEALGADDSPLAAAIAIFKAPETEGGQGGLGKAVAFPDGYSVITHSGGTGGYTGFVACAPDWGRGVVVLANAACGAVGDLGFHLLDTRRALHWHRQEIEVDPALFDRYVGRYRMTPSFILTVLREGDRLFVQATGQDRKRIFPAGERHYFCKAVGAQITFEIGADGRADRLILHQNSLDQMAERMPDRT